MKHPTQQLRTGPLRHRGFVSLDYAIVGTTVLMIVLALELGASAKSLLILIGL